MEKEVARAGAAAGLIAIVFVLGTSYFVPEQIESISRSDEKIEWEVDFSERPPEP